MSKTIDQLPVIKPRESKFTINDIRTKIAYIPDDDYFKQDTRFNAEVFVCLANKIFELENRIKELENK